MIRSAMLAPALAGAILMGGPAAAAGADDRSASQERRRTPVVNVFEAARDAVVSISSTEIVNVHGRSPFDSLFEDFFDMPRRSTRRQRLNVGSGFVIHPDGYIVTNAHVVARTTEQKVTFGSGNEVDAQIVALDERRDLAVLKIDTNGSHPTLPLGRSDDLMIGETVIAIGNPLGLQHTVTAGVVSAVNRDLEISNQIAFEGLIQTDASINPGNSGGPLLNVEGELIGVNCAIRGDAQNIGFAIPVDQLREVLPSLLDVERRYRIDTGLTVDHLAAPRVTEVRAGSPAELAGIRIGDVLREVDGEPVREGIDFDIALINRQADDALPLLLERDGRTVRARLRLLERPAPDGRELARARLGIDVVPLPEDIARQLDLERSGGVLIERVEFGGPAHDAGVHRYDILLAMGRYYVASVEELGNVLESLESGDVVNARILRVERRRKTQRSGAVRIR
jgi:serine protease Do